MTKLDRYSEPIAWVLAVLIGMFLCFVGWGVYKLATVVL